LKIKVMLQTIGIVLIKFIAAFFAGMGLNQFKIWLGYEPWSYNFTLIYGILVIFLCYDIPQFIARGVALRKVRRYFPITNDVLHANRGYFLELIAEEIQYLEQAVEETRLRGLVRDHQHYQKSLQTMKEIQSQLIQHRDLRVEELCVLNQVFDFYYLLKKME